MNPMPFVDHNDPAIVEAMIRKSNATRDLLRQLRHVVEHGHAELPKRLVAELAGHAAQLSYLIDNFTIRHDYVDHAEYLTVMQYVAEEAKSHPQLLTGPVVHVVGPDEETIYRDQLGFSEHEYRDLLVWKEAWDAHAFDPDAAFGVFVSRVVADLHAGKYTIRPEDIAPGVAGVLGIAVDVTIFAATVGVVGPAVVGALVSSCATGLAAIAAKFPVVRDKLLHRGR